MALPNLGAHPNAVDMATTKQREIRSNSRDYLLDESNNGAVDVDVSAGGTITPTTDERLANGHLRFTGTPATDPVLNIPDDDRQLAFNNTTAKDIRSTDGDGELLLESVDSLLLEDGSGVLLLEASTILIPTIETRLLQKEGATYHTIGRIGLEAGALLHSGDVSPTALINFADNVIAKAEFKDYAFTVTSPSISSGTLVLDVENGNVFDVTLTENVTTLTLSNAASNAFEVQLEDGSGGIQLEDGSGNVLLEDDIFLVTIIFIAKQDSGGGNIITWGTEIQWEQDTGDSPNQTLTGNAIDIYLLQTISGGASWYGVVLGLDMK